MALTEPTLGRVIQKVYGEGVEVAAGEILVCGDLVGYSSGFKKADGNAAIYAQWVAGNSARSGDPVTLYEGVLVGGYTGGTPGSTLYLSDTAGCCSETAGTVTQTVGTVITASQMEFRFSGGSSSPTAPENLGDSIALTFGDSLDVNIQWDATNLIIKPVANDTGIVVCNTTALGMDWKWVPASASTAYFSIDRGLSAVMLEQTVMKFGDNDKLHFGDASTFTASATGDAEIYWDATTLQIKSATITTNGNIKVGTGKGILVSETSTGSSIDLQAYNADSSTYSSVLKVSNATASVKLGFFGKGTLAAQATAMADATGDDSTAVNAIIDLLQAIGIMST